MEAKIEAMEDKALASEELTSEISGDSLKDEFEKLEEAKDDIDAMNELEALKAKLANKE